MKLKLCRRILNIILLNIQDLRQKSFEGKLRVSADLSFLVIFFKCVRITLFYSNVDSIQQVNKSWSFEYTLYLFAFSKLIISSFFHLWGLLTTDLLYHMFCSIIFYFDYLFLITLVLVGMKTGQYMFLFCLNAIITNLLFVLHTERKNQHNSRNVFHKLVSDLFLHQWTKWLIVLNVTRKWCMTLLCDVKNAKLNDVKTAKWNDVS